MQTTNAASITFSGSRFASTFQNSAGPCMVKLQLQGLPGLCPEPIAAVSRAMSDAALAKCTWMWCRERREHSAHRRIASAR
jgi:hypothetical protein